VISPLSRARCRYIRYGATLGNPMPASTYLFQEIARKEFEDELNDLRDKNPLPPPPRKK